MRSTTRIEFLIFLACLLFRPEISAQPTIKNYDREWKKVMGFIEKNRPLSAYDVTKQIYEQAKTDQQDAQVIKALLYMSGLPGKRRKK